ncbi:MAG TPA: type II toxin-antitoxin system RelE/ParE family toxin [Polyangia bacterium]
MTRALRFSAWALEQLEEALAYIAADDPEAAAAMADRIERRLTNLERFPHAGRVVPELGDPARREIIVVPYRIIYRADSDEIRILAVIHGRRRLEGALPGDAEE